MSSDYRYVLLNKPYGILSQFTSEEEHRNLSEFGLPSDIYAAGRLDKDSEGLLLLTNDGPFIKKFLDSHPRTYWVQVERVPTEEDLHILRNGVKIKGGNTSPCLVKSIQPPSVKERNPPIRFRKKVPTSWIEITLTEGKNRQVRRMTAKIGFPTLRLIRVGLGKIKLKDLDLLPGRWIEIEKNQIVCS